MITWLITNLITPFLPRDHPWKCRYFPLTEWLEGRTEMCKYFDLILSLYALAIIIVFAIQKYWPQ